MFKPLSLLAAILCITPCFAQQIDISDIDSAARSAKTNSIMFRSQNDNAAYEEEMRRRAEYEEEMKRQAYEAEMKRREALKPVNLFGNSLKIFAEVNGEIITSRDMQSRVNAFVATTQIPITDNNKKMVMEKVLQATIDEKIKLQEAEKNNIKVSESELDTGMLNFAKSNGITLADFKQMLKNAQVDESVFRSQMKAEMVWARLVQRKAAQTVKISKSEMDKALDAINKDVKKHKFLVSEIVIPKKKANGIEYLVENLKNDPRFELYAMQFSESPTAKNGGHIGWVSMGQLANQLEQALLKMKDGSISAPIALGQDYYILKLEKTYVPGVDKAPVLEEKQVREMLENKKMEEIAEKYIRDLRNKAIINRKA